MFGLLKVRVLHSVSGRIGRQDSKSTGRRQRGIQSRCVSRGDAVMLLRRPLTGPAMPCMDYPSAASRLRRRAAGQKGCRLPPRLHVSCFALACYAATHGPWLLRWVLDVARAELSKPSTSDWLGGPAGIQSSIYAVRTHTSSDPDRKAFKCHL